MDFFGAQDRARRNTSRLLFLFGAAVIALVVLTDVAVAVAFGFLQAGAPLDPARLLVVSGVVCGGIGLASLFKHLQLARGGKVVAEMLGGRLLDPASTEPAERRLLNIVEEMALAAGLPVPPVYVLPEASINAFAAGHASADAVIGVTEGSMRLLARDELQGVVAHEFSHVLNGDMRLNLRLIAVLHGILFIALTGRLLLQGAGRSSRRSSSRDNSGLLLLGLGLSLLLIGWVGVFFGRLIKAGVSREREYLADASAVQFTRNPLGLAGALRKIGGLGAHGLIANPRAETASHLFFAQALNTRLLSLFATHPPLHERIRLLDPAWNGELPAADPEPVSIEAEEEQVASMAAPAVVLGIDAGQAPGAFPPAGVGGLPRAVLAGCRHPELAVALTLNALIDPATALTSAQMNLLATCGALLPEELRRELSGTQATAVVELAMPALKRLDAAARRGLLETVAALAALDGHLDLREFAVATLLEHHLSEEAGRARAARARYSRIEQVSAPLSVILSALSAGDAARFASAAALAGLPELRPVALGDIGWPSVRAGLGTLRGLYPLLKPRVLKASRSAVGTAGPGMEAILQPLALALDCASVDHAA